MGNIFSRRKKKKKSRITETDNQILTLKFQRDQLIVFRRQLEFQYQQAEDAAKAYVYLVLEFMMLDCFGMTGRPKRYLPSSVANTKVSCFTKRKLSSFG
jgi:hypothetical protein